MIVVEVAEYGKSGPLSLAPETVAELTSTDALDARYLADGRCKLKAKQFVGVVRASSGVEVRIRPKVSIGRLLYLLLMARRGEWLPEELEHGAADDDLVETLAPLFLLRTEAVLRAGVLQGYLSVDEATPTVRGRLREGDQLRKRFGLPLPVEVRYDNLLPDIPENQVLLAAARELSFYVRDGAMRRRLRHVMSRLDGVSPLPRGPIPEIRYTRLNERYRPAIEVATLVLEGASVALGGAGRRGSAFLFDMNRVFEDFLVVALRGELSGSGYEVRQGDAHAMVAGLSLRIEPDITIWRHGRCVALADAKYKRLKKGEVIRSDLYQLHTYCAVLKQRVGHLIYPVPVDRALPIRNTSVSVHLRGLDIRVPLRDLRRAVRDLASRLVDRSATSTAGRPSQAKANA